MLAIRGVSYKFRENGQEATVMRRDCLATTCVLLVIGCASAQSNGAAANQEPVEDSHVIVQNDYMGDVEVFILNGTIRNRLGRVSVGAKVRFIIPARLMERPDVQFQVTPAAATSSGFTYAPISMSQGSTVELHVARVLASSTHQIVGR